MKLLNAIVSAVVIGSAVPLISSAPAVAGCYPSTAASEYGDMLNAGTSTGKVPYREEIIIAIKNKLS